MGATGLVMDVRTGEVLAMVSLRTLTNRPLDMADGALFNRARAFTRWAQLSNYLQAMALDSGTISMSDGYDASKPIRIASFTIGTFTRKTGGYPSRKLYFIHLILELQKWPLGWVALCSVFIWASLECLNQLSRNT